MNVSQRRRTRAIRDAKRCARVAYGAISSGFLLRRCVLSSVLLDARSRFCIFPALGRKPHITHSVKFNVGLVAYLDWFVAQLLSQTRGLPITLVLTSQRCATSPVSTLDWQMQVGTSSK